MNLRRLAYGILLTSLTSALAMAGNPPAPSIPMEPYVAGLVVVSATVNGQRGTFLFDTGEGVSIVTPAFAEKVGCKPWGQITGFRLTGERLDAPHCDGLTYEMAGTRFQAPAVGVFDVMKFIGANAPPVDGTLGLDVFAGHVVTLVPSTAIVIETPKSLGTRIAAARELPARLVRDAEGVSLTVNGAVQTSQGTAWMELDTGNSTGLFVGNHIAPLLGMSPDVASPVDGSLTLANGIVVSGSTRTANLIMDGNIGAEFLNHWILTLDLDKGRAWLAPYKAEKKAGT